MVLFNQYKDKAPIVVRIAISLVFLWFGLSQLITPQAFYGYIPAWDIISGFQVGTLVLINGIIDTILGVALLVGIFTRVAALVACLHLVGIILGLGYNDVAVRDFGLLLVTFSIFLHGTDSYCLDTKIFK